MNPLRFAKRSVRAVVRRGLVVGPVRRLVEGELARLAKAKPAPSSSLPMATFTDRKGVTHPLDPSLRDRLKPNWRVMCDPEQMAAPPSAETLRARIRKAVKAATELERTLALTTGTSVAGRILEIGCYDGSAAYELSRRPGTTVVASDLTRYYAVQHPGQPEAEAVAAEEVALARLRELARGAAGRPEGSVTFVEDDITGSNLERSSFDLIVSFEVLEHVADPTDAFRAMAGLLRPGGVMYHDYNPFFSMIGGHSLATLDFAWGHARLDTTDVERYLREIRPAEAEQAFRFYRGSLNRMTQVDLRDAIGAAGLERVAIVPWNQRALLIEATTEVLAEVRANYPRATLEDLLGTFVVVVARQPATAT
jgi:2-polyprenyl-3-methyl-5-hydroxy-6-metoxy-1,4-benzoquinol methylase